MSPGRPVLQHRGILHLPVRARFLRRRLPLHPRYSHSSTWSSVWGGLPRHSWNLFFIFCWPAKGFSNVISKKETFSTNLNIWVHRRT